MALDAEHRVSERWYVTTKIPHEEKSIEGHGAIQSQNAACDTPKWFICHRISSIQHRIVVEGEEEMISCSWYMYINPGCAA